jgi:hypothetical protein
VFVEHISLSFLFKDEFITSQEISRVNLVFSSKKSQKLRILATGNVSGRQEFYCIK